MSRSLVRLGDLVEAVDERQPGDDLPTLSVSEGRGIVRQDSLFKKKIATDDRSKYRIVREGDVAYNPFLLWNGAAGVCFVEGGGAVSPAYVVLRPVRPGGEYFIHYLFRSEEMKNKVAGIASGTVTRRRVAPLADVLELEFRLPQWEEVRRLSTGLAALDQQAVSAGLAAEIAGQVLIRSCLIGDSDGVPAKLCNLVASVRETARPSELEPSEPYVGLEHFVQGSPLLTQSTPVRDVKSNVARFRSGDILYGRLRPNLRKVAIAPIDGYCSTEILVLRPLEESLRGIALAKLLGDDLLAYAVGATTGTRMPRVHWDHLAEFAVMLPPDRSGPRSRLAASVADYIAALARQTSTVDSMREILVPLALHGRRETAV